MPNYVRQLDNALTEPSDHLIQFANSLPGDLLILGAGGKMGPTFAHMARRALDAAGKTSRVIAVSRFTNDALPREFAPQGIETVSGDLFDANFVRSLPEVENILYLVGMKFGTATDAARTWASNTYVAGLVAERFHTSRIVALSTGNVYGPVPVDHGHGATELSPIAPDGEYAASAVGRERIFEYFSHQHGTHAAIIRLNYATEFRYGVLVDLAQKVFRNETISLATGYFNAIWQPDACDMILRTFAHATSPPLVLNITGLERLSVRTVCEHFGKLLDRQPTFTGTESATSLLSDAHLARHLLGPPPTSVEQMIERTADWIARDGQTWNRPTHFEVRNGKF